MPTRRIRPNERRRCGRACLHCKRRKERCDGQKPCSRCSERGVAQDCKLSPSPNVLSTLQTPEPGPQLLNPAGDGSSGTSARDQNGEHPLLSFAHISRMVRDDQGTLMFIGDASNLCFLQIIRRVISENFGRCALLDDPLRHYMVEAHPKNNYSLAQGGIGGAPPIPTAGEMEYFLVWFQRATDCILQLFDPVQMRNDVAKWLREPDSQPLAKIATFHLIVAIGALTGPIDHDDLADRHFNYGRYITLTTLMDNPSLPTVQCHALSGLYLLSSSRRNAAFMYLGVAVRGAYALGLHRRDVSVLHDSAEFMSRERLWRAIRIMDLFMSASLGRPPATAETRDTTSNENYSASNDLCWIFESILTGVYAKRAITTDILERISLLHRRWAAKFTGGLQADGIRPGRFNQEEGEEPVPNVGLIHLKEAYYWTIILLSRPFLVQHVSSTLEQQRTMGSSPFGPSSLQTSPSYSVVVDACVDSALRTADLLKPLTSSRMAPKRLPFVVNSAFGAALILGLVIFADLDNVSCATRAFQDCRDILAKFSTHDAVTKRYLTIVDHLQAASASAAQARRKKAEDSRCQSIGQLFGNITGDFTKQNMPQGGDEIQGRPSPPASQVGLGSVAAEVTASTAAEVIQGCSGSTATIFDFDARISAIWGQPSPLTTAADMQSLDSQPLNLLSPGTLFLGEFDEGMLLPMRGDSMMGFELG